MSWWEGERLAGGCGLASYSHTRDDGEGVCPCHNENLMVVIGWSTGEVSESRCCLERLFHQHLCQRTEEWKNGRMGVGRSEAGTEAVPGT